MTSFLQLWWLEDSGRLCARGDKKQLSTENSISSKTAFEK